MIKLTRFKTNESVWVNPELIVSVGEQEHGIGFNEMLRGVFVHTSPNYSLQVTESPEEVTRKILEYKLAMVRYGAAVTDNVRVENTSDWEANDCFLKFERLAGLEE